MTPARLNLTIYRGVDFDKTLTWLTGEPPEPVDLTGWTGEMELCDSDDNLILTATTSNGQLVLGDAAGTVQIILANAVTDTFTFDTGHYRIRLNSGSAIYAFAGGDVTILWNESCQA